MNWFVLVDSDEKIVFWHSQVNKGVVLVLLYNNVWFLSHCIIVQQPVRVITSYPANYPHTAPDIISRKFLLLIKKQSLSYVIFDLNRAENTHCKPRGRIPLLIAVQVRDETTCVVYVTINCINFVYELPAEY